MVYSGRERDASLVNLQYSFLNKIHTTLVNMLMGTKGFHKSLSLDKKPTGHQSIATVGRMSFLQGKKLQVGEVEVEIR